MEACAEPEVCYEDVQAGEQPDAPDDYDHQEGKGDAKP